jgi:hypothetical protein
MNAARYIGGGRKKENIWGRNKIYGEEERN